MLFDLLKTLRRGWRLLPTNVRGLAASAIAGPVSALSTAGMPNAGKPPCVRVKTVLIVSTFAVRSGISEAARLLARELRTENFDVVTHDVSRDLRLPVTFEEPQTRSEDTAPDAVIFHLNPPQLDAILPYLPPTWRRAPLRIGYWAWELEELPQHWKRFGRFFHAIWVPSGFVATAVRRSLPSLSVEVVPHPVALKAASLFGSQMDARNRLGLSADDFVVGQSFSITSGVHRKNPADAIRAFSRAFSGSEHAVLILRCIDAPAHPLLYEELCRLATEHECRTLFVGPEVPMHVFYDSLDTYLSLHRTEGFGLNLAEAMLAQLPVVATGWSGNLEFMSPEVAKLVPYKLIEVDDPQTAYVAPGLVWAQPDVDKAAEFLRDLYDHRPLGADLGRCARAFAQTRLSGGAAARALRSYELHTAAPAQVSYR